MATNNTWQLEHAGVFL